MADKFHHIEDVIDKICRVLLAKNGYFSRLLPIKTLKVYSHLKQNTLSNINKFDWDLSLMICHIRTLILGMFEFIIHCIYIYVD